MLAASNASKSQLYHYFADKDDFVLAVVQRQTECVLAAQESLLKNFPRLAGLRRWRDALVELSKKNDGAGGCPLGSLVPEPAESIREDASPARRRLQTMGGYLVAGFTMMRTRGELKPAADPADLATAVLTALQGGLLLAQTMRSTRPLELALDMALQHVVAKSR